MKRIKQKFLELAAKKQCAFVSYICAGDPNYETSLKVLKSMPKAGVDIIELGVPFLDPSGDGPVIQKAAKRAITSGMTLKKVLEMVEEFRKSDEKTPLILMSYYNPILKYGIDKIFADAAKSGVDGFLIVDLPLEEELEITSEINKNNLDLIRLIAPTTSQDRAKKIAQNSSGFLYLVSLLGVTGVDLAGVEENKNKVEKLREVSELPIVVGFGIKGAKQAGDFSRIGANGVVVGSTIVAEIDKNFLEGKTSAEITEATTKKLQEFSIEIKK